MSIAELNQKREVKVFCAELLAIERELKPVHLNKNYFQPPLAESRRETLESRKAFIEKFLKDISG